MHNLELAIIRNLVNALAKMIECSVVHSNLQPKCIIVTPVTWEIKIINFVYGHKMNGRTQIPLRQKPPTSAYQAPEILEKNMVSFNSDLYSFGVILGEMKLDGPRNRLSVESHSQFDTSELISRLKQSNFEKRPTI